MASHVHLALKLECAKVYLHSPIRIHGLVLGQTQEKFIKCILRRLHIQTQNAERLPCLRLDAMEYKPGEEWKIS
jgi:hypothetical protein